MPQFETHFFSSLLFWEVVSFAVLLWVLWRYAFPPILENLDARERKIRESLEQAERNREAAEVKMREYEAKLNAATREAESLLAEAKGRAQKLMEENEQRLTADADRIKADAAQEIDRERRKAVQDIRAQTTDLALAVAEKVIERSLTDADHRRLADEALAAITKTKG
jgi:F-type H+-transporting ATPase subunit b